MEWHRTKDCTQAELLGALPGVLGSSPIAYLLVPRGHFWFHLRRNPALSFRHVVLINVYTLFNYPRPVPSIYSLLF